MRILVPTDFSESAKHAENTAIYIAKQNKADINFLHCLAVGMDWSKVSKEKENQYPEIQAGIRKAEQQLIDKVELAKAAGISATMSLAFLQNYKTVTNSVIDQKHDMIVMGSHGEGGFRKFVLGANAGKILRTAKTPVLIVQRELPPSGYKTIVFASGLEPDTHEAFERLLQFAKNVGAKNLHFVEVTTPHNFKPTNLMTQAMEAFVAQHKIKNIQLHNYNHYSIEGGVIEFAKEIDADLIAIANHGRTDLSSLFIESIPENLVKYSEYPVLSIRV
jgi:nucleotide-binding universal stress UspA family protein